MPDSLDDAIFAKAVVIREGSASRTPLELSDVFIDDACALLKIERPEEDNILPGNAGDDEYEIANELANHYEALLASAGFTTVWDDGYVIYNGLTDQEAEYLFESYP